MTSTAGDGTSGGDLSAGHGRVAVPDSPHVADEDSDQEDVTRSVAASWARHDVKFRTSICSASWQMAHG